MANEDNIFLKALNFVSPANLWESVVGAVTGKNEDLQNNPNPSFDDRLGSAMNNSQLFSGIGTGIKAVENAPIVGAPLKFVLDFGNRTADSFFTGLQAEGDSSDSTSFLDGWKHGWDTYGEPGHLSAGNLIGANVTDMFSSDVNGIGALNPLNPHDAEQLRQVSKSTWYGDITGGVSDLAAGFITPVTPVAKVAKVAAEAKTINSLADAEAVTESFNSGRIGAKGNSVLGLNADNRAARLDELVTESLKHSSTNSDAMNFFGPRMGHAHEQTKRIMAETLYFAGQLPEGLAKHVIGNAYLAAMGSDAARAELVAASPLIASKIANAALPPVIFENVVQAQSALIDAFSTGQDVRVPQIISQVLETPRKVAEQKALSDALEHAKLDAQQAKDFRTRLAGLRPQFRQKVDGKYVDTNFDTARLRESRDQAAAQHDSLKSQLDAAKAELADAQRMAGVANRDVVSKGAFQDAKAAADSKAGRDAVAAFGPYNDAADFNKTLGAAQQKVADLTERLKVARGDRDLLNSTPLNDPEAMGKWATDMKSARSGTSQAIARRDLLASMNRVAKRQLREDVRVAKQMRPSLNATANWLADIESLGEGSLNLSGARVTPTYLDRAKTAYRDYIGRSYLYDAGDYSSRTIFHVHPQAALASIGTDYGRSAVQTLDRYRGQQELAMYLKKSGVYQGDEIAQAVESYLRAAPSDVASVVSRVHDDMLKRIVADVAPTMSDADVTKAVGGLRSGLNGSRSYLTGALQKADSEGSKWADLQEFPDETASGAFHKVDAAFLRSHLADTVPFADPVQVRKAIQRFVGDGTARMVGQGALGALDAYTAGWKLANLIRPGLFFRNMLDTGLRSLAIMGAGTTLMSAVNGTRHKMLNDAFKVGDWVASKNAKAGSALEKIGMHDPEGMVRHMLGDGGVKVNVGNGKTASPSLYDLSPDGRATHTSVAANWSAMTRGMPVHEGLMNESQRVLDTMLQNRKAWDIYKADSIEWPRAYAEHAETLLASPTARKMIEQDSLPAAAQMDGAQRVRELFSDPAVRDEYNQLARNLDMTREQFIEQVDWELEHMFPEPGMAQDLMAGKFRGHGGKAWIEDHFPPELRFDVPGFESIFEHSSRAADSARTLVRKTIDSFFRVMMDEPDFWLVRHPVAVKAFADQIKVESSRLLERRVAQYGDQAELTGRDISKITQRARTHAIGVVRDYMYDTTKNTALSQSLHRVVPFFGPYYDVMRAYGKLIYDDPQRLFTISGLYNAPTNINQWLNEPLIVDVNGEAVRPGQVPTQGGGEGYLVFNGPGFDGQLRLRRSSFNTLLMGDVPWLPGWGPAVTIPASIVIGSNKELALKLSNSDNPAIRTLMQSLWPDGEVPANDLSSIAKAQIPAWLRKVWDGQQGVAFARNTQYALNQAYIDSQRNGTLFDYNKEFAKAQEAARSASWVNAISQFGFGISGDAAVQGRFYVDQMHQLQALAERPAGGGPSVLQQMGYPSPEAAFAEKFPEAANLRWSFTRNETGINATVQAQDAALNLQPIIDKAPDLGWFVVGADNVGGEWSQTAYNQQKTGTYGSAQKGRKTLDAGEAAAQAHEAYGWDQFTKLNTMLSNLSVQYGLEQDVVEGVKQWIVQSIGKDNPAWFAAYNDRTNKVADFYQQADLLAKDPKLAKRQDIAMYVTYRKAMDEVMQSFGIKSLAGTGAATVQARLALNTLGSQMARQNIGFQQMWDRMLYNDVKPRASDARFGYVDSANGAPDPAGLGLTG